LEEKANVQVGQNGSQGKLDKLSFLISNSRTSRSWLVLVREAMIWDDRWLTPGLVMQKKIVPLKKIFNRRLAVSLVSIPLPPYSAERLVP
jgi:hypothetical protein